MRPIFDVRCRFLNGSIVGLCIFFVLSCALPNATGAPSNPELTISEVVDLKSLGFDEDAIKAEVLRSKKSFTLSEADRKALEKAGFSKEFVAFLRSLQPKKRLNNDSITALLKKGKSAEEILKEIQGSEKAFDTSPRAILAQNKKAKIPLVVVMAMRGNPLNYDQLKLLANNKATGPEISLLLDIVGFKGEALSPPKALELFRAKVPQKVIAKLRSLPQLVSDKSAKGDIPRPGYFPHPLGLFTLRYPPTWKLIREIDDGGVIYSATPETSKEKGEDITIGFRVNILGIGKGAVAETMTPSQSLERILPLALQQEPGLQLDGKVSKTKMGTIPAARQALKGKLKKKEGEFRGELYVAIQDKFIIVASTVAPAGRFGDFQKSFDDILKKSSFSAASLSLRKDNPYSTQELVSKYKESVVSIFSPIEKGKGAASTGTGFIIRDDGYILTNHHVIWNSKLKRPHPRIFVEWDESLNKPRQEAKLIGYKGTYQGQDAVNWGIDVALLKIEGEKPYKPIPISPLSQVRLGDPVLTMGFPLRGTLKTLSTVVTSGVVTRFNKDFLGDTSAIFIDAAISSGNSGGPSINRITGAVMGINSFRTPAKAALNLAGFGDLMNYKGVIPINMAIKEFPVALGVSPEREKTLDAVDYYDLAQRSADLGATNGSIILAKKAVALAPKSADARFLLGRLRITFREKKGDFEEGVNSLNQALKLDENHIPSLLFLANVKRFQGEPVEAVKFANRAVESEGSAWQGYLTRANINVGIRRYDEALEDLDKVKKLTRNTLPQPYLLAGRVYYRTKKYEEGKQEYVKAVELHPSSLEAQMGFAQFFMHKKNYIAALLEYDKIHKQQSKNPSVKAAMGRAYSKIGKYKKSMDMYFDSMNWSNKLKRIPAPYVLYETAGVARKVKQTNLAILLYARYLRHYHRRRGAFNVHMAASNITKNKFSKGIAKGHLISASLIRENNKSVKKQIQELRNVRMSKADIKRMLKLRYPPQVAGRIISVTPLNFRLPNKRAHVAFLNEKEFKKARRFGFEALVGVLKSQKRYKNLRPPRNARGQQRQARRAPARRGQAPPPRQRQARRPNTGGRGAPPPPRRNQNWGTQPRQQRASVPGYILGTWIGNGRDPRFGAKFEILLTLKANGEYDSSISAGYRGIPDKGNYTVSGNLIKMKSYNTSKVTLMRITRTNLVIDLRQWGRVPMRKYR